MTALVPEPRLASDGLVEVPGQAVVVGVRFSRRSAVRYQLGQIKVLHDHIVSV